MVGQKMISDDTHRVQPGKQRGWEALQLAMEISVRGKFLGKTHFIDGGIAKYGGFLTWGYPQENHHFQARDFP